MTDKTAPCPICDVLPDHSAANRNDGSSLPEAADRLKDVHEGESFEYARSGQKEYTVLKKCPVCGRKYEYSYYYDYSPGYIEEIITLIKL